MAVAPKKQKQWLKECFAAWKQTDVAYSRLAHSRNLSLNMVWAFECLSEHPEGVEPAVLADEAKLLRQSMTVVLNDLEDQGLVTREFHPTDRRRKMIKLTSRGKKVCREILYTIAQCELEALSGLGEEEQRLFFELNTRFCQGLATKLAAAANSSDK